MDILNINFDQLLFRLKIISFFLCLLFGGLAVYFIMQFQKLVGLKSQMMRLAQRNTESASGGASQTRWEEILDHVNSAKEGEWKFAIIEADKLVDDLLKSSGYPGETMGERLMSIEKGQLLGLEGLWEAHKIRNKLAHDSNYFLRQAEARRAIQLYENVLKELSAV